METLIAFATYFPIQILAISVLLWHAAADIRGRTRPFRAPGSVPEGGMAATHGQPKAA